MMGGCWVSQPLRFRHDHGVEKCCCLHLDLGLKTTKIPTRDLFNMCSMVLGLIWPLAVIFDVTVLHGEIGCRIHNLMCTFLAPGSTWITRHWAAQQFLILLQQSWNWTVFSFKRWRMDQSRSTQVSSYHILNLIRVPIIMFWYWCKTYTNRSSW